MSQPTKPIVVAASVVDEKGVERPVEILPEKGLLNSGTVRNVIYMILAQLVALLVDNSPAVQVFIMGLTPDWLDPIAAVGFQQFVNVLSIMFGVRAAAARAKVGDLKGLYKKPALPAS